MYKRTIYLTLILMLSVFQVKAQSLATQLTQTKFKIIRASVNFLTTDTTKFKNIEVQICDACDDYAGLIAFAENNELKGVKALIVKWKDIRLDTGSVDKAIHSLNEFKQKVLSDITTGRNAYRTKPPFNFEEFRSFVIANTVKANAPLTVINEPVVKADDLSQSIMADSDVPLISFRNIVYLELAIILGLLVYLFFKSRKEKRRKTRIINPERNHEQLVYELQEKIKLKENEVREQDVIIDGLNVDLELLKNSIDNAIKDALPNETDKEAVLSNEIAKPHQQRLPERFYTKYADLIDGFSVAELVEEENNETIFEIRLQSPNKATFKVSENPAAQKYALTNADYFLQKTCMYDVVPFGKITTEKDGQLSLSGGKWEIVELAKISFK